MTTFFIMSEFMIKVLNKFFHFDKSESSLLQNSIMNDSFLMTFYQDDILEEHRSFENQFAFLRNHFLSKIKWFKLRLTFKKLYLFQKTIKVLKIIHIIKEEIRILSDKCEKIVNFSILITFTEVRTFLKVIKMIKKWVFNFFELRRSLTRFIEKINWRWIVFEQLSFEILRIKYSVITVIHEINYFNVVHFYTNAFMYDEDLIITQFRQRNEKIVEISILYDVYTFNSAEKKYSVYKKKLCVLIKSVIKYDHFCKNFVILAIIHIDHKSLIHFLKFDRHEKIYEHWTNKMRDLNIEIKYISERRNKIADELFKTIFRRKNCEFDSNVKFAFKFLHDEEFTWIWKNDKIEYEEFLKELIDKKKLKVIDNETFDEKLVFINVFNAETFISEFWKNVYLVFHWFENIYKFLILENSVNKDDLKVHLFVKLMKYRIDFHSFVLWKNHRFIYLSCIFESMIVIVLRHTHDEDDHFQKKKNIRSTSRTNVLIINVYRCWTIYSWLFKMCTTRFNSQISVVAFNTKWTLILIIEFWFRKFITFVIWYWRFLYLLRDRLLLSIFHNIFFQDR
jgi:hypothetical protein